MEHIKLLEDIFDKKILRVLRFVILNKDNEYYLQEISKETEIPIATVFRIMGKLTALGIVLELKIKKFKLYRCADNEKVTFLESFLKEGKRIAENFANLASKLPNVEEIILYGEEGEDKANIMLIGNGIDNNSVKQLCAEFKEKYNFNVTALNLQREQFEQISSMGLYSGSKETLYKNE